MDHAAIVVELGGYRAVADALGVRHSVVFRWGRGRTIPPRRWPWIIARAREMGVEGVTLEALERCDESEASLERRRREADLRALRAAGGPSPGRGGGGDGGGSRGGGSRGGARVDGNPPAPSSSPPVANDGGSDTKAAA